MPRSFIETLTVWYIFVAMVTLGSNFLKTFVQTPPLWLGHEFGITQFTFPEIDYAVVKETTLPTAMRLGHKMEHLFLKCLEGQDKYIPLAHNVVIKKENTTLGEIDFLLKDTLNHRTIHLELTYKFYLVDNSLAEPMDQLIGPNRRDTFVTKLEKLRNTQFRMPFFEEGIKQLLSLGIKKEELEQEVCFKVQVFTPYQHTSLLNFPLNNLCIAGYWLRISAFSAKEFRAHEYYFPTKDEWILTPCNIDSWNNYNDSLLYIKSRMQLNRSILVWMKKGESVYEKFFVVWW
jgi:hypothetical protein